MKSVWKTSLFIKISIASVDQAILSLVNFAISIILIKKLTMMEYGYYAIAFPISLFLISIQNALVNTPLAVLLVTKKGNSKPDYLGSLYHGQLLVIIPATVLSLAAIFLLYHSGLDRGMASVAGSVCVAGFGLLLREFMRACFFAEEIPERVLYLDFLYAIALACSMAFVLLFAQISVPTAFFIMGGCSLAVALLFSARQGWQFNWQAIKENNLENWKFGKWALAGVLVTHIQHYSYLYLLGAMLGSVAVAEVSAGRLLLMPLLLAQAGWCKIAIPHGSKLREQDRLSRLFKEQIVVSIFLVLAIALYTYVLTMSFPLIQDLFLTDKYEKSSELLWYWAAIMAMSFIALNASNGLQVLGQFRFISKVNFITMLITVGCAYTFIHSHAIKGGLTALLIGETALALFLWIHFRNMVFGRSISADHPYPLKYKAIKGEQE
jgi:O-antigen/teichoic acid export membrane protein